MPRHIHVYYRKKAKSGLKLLERGGNPEQHFAKLRAVSLTVQDPPNRDTNSKATPFVSLKHAQSSVRGTVPAHVATGTEDDLIRSSTSALPRALDQPNKPTKYNRLPDLVETAVRNIESLDTKRAHINSMDARGLAGLDIASRKRKYGIALNGQGQVASKAFYYPTEAKPRTFVASPSPEPRIIVDTCAEQVEDMLSFGTPSDEQSTNSTQTFTIHSNGQTRDEPTADAPPVSTKPAEPQASTKEIDIPPTLYEDARRVAAQTLKLQDGLLGLQSNVSLIPWRTQPTEDDSEILTFNLFMPAPANTGGIPPDPEPRIKALSQQGQDSTHSHSGAPDKAHGLNIGNQTGNNSRRDRNQHAEKNKASDLPVRPHGKHRMETPQGTKPSPPLPPRKLTEKTRTNSGRGSMAPNPLDRYVLRSHPSHPRRASDQVKLFSDHSNVHRKPDDREPTGTTQSAPKLDSSHAIFDFASAESSPSPSQEIGVSMTTSDDNNRKIGLQLFDDDPRAGVEVEA
ncbi:unnamed protein product [Rhizoctonia solani]|uniref:Uncharacterized protein n=1 Tax=Rhizoctonia solani TaxID=456999 RepID=A0A8H3DWJ6_9AGAM|nr:unnamed protein product [Rhizoctonia solani]